MVGVVIFMCFLIIFFCLIVVVERRSSMYGYDYDDEEYEVTTTTTTTTTTVAEQPEYVVVGKLQRQAEGIQYFVIDPADGEKIWVNNSDDLYRDADDRVWKLV